jgi:hypothetical protein
MRRDTDVGTPVEKTMLTPVEEEILRAVRRIRYASAEITIRSRLDRTTGGSYFWRR